MWCYLCNLAISIVQRRMTDEAYMREIARHHISLSETMDCLPPSAAHTPAAKCQCCGSREFVQHKNKRICSYCRSGA